MSSAIGLSKNFSFYTVPAAWMLCIAPFIYSVRVYDSNSSDDRFDRVNPRTFMPALEKNESVKEATKAKISRAWAASQNGFENIGFFASAVVAANVAKVDPWWTNTLSTGYLFSRLVFNMLYIHGYPGELRGAVFYTGTGLIITLFIMSGNALRRLSN